MEFSETKPPTDEFLLKTNRLPVDINFMPTLGNGHLGFTVYGDAIFMNGLYNGHAGDSRRARIPNWLNLSLSSKSLLGDEVQNSYELLLEDGYYRSVKKAESVYGGLGIEQRFYAHRYYTRALIYELKVERTDVSEPFGFYLDMKPGKASDAFEFTDIEPNILKGKTLIVEHEEFQKDTRTVLIAFSERFTGQKFMEMAIGEKKLYYRYVITIDENEDVARKELKNVLAEDSNSLLRLHINEWRNFWKDFNIHVGGNIELSLTINAGLFYLANSLPSHNASQPNLPLFGLSPTGLGRGNLDDDYEGHHFWDTDIWMLPVVTQLSTNWSEQLLEYRLRNLPGAEYNAKMTGYHGARFPWESAFTGTEVTHPDYPEVAQYQIHISADIAFALQQFYAVTSDREWLCAKAWPLLKKIATFLVSRVEKNTRTGEYHIKDVMGPDEDHCNVTDNVYTNVVFKIALKFASFAQKQCQPNGSLNSEWEEIANRLVVLYDPCLDYHPQHLGYTSGEQIKQADVVLLGFPLQYPMNLTTHLNDLNSYAKVTRASGPAMTWSMMAINYLDVGDIQKSNLYFEKCYQDYARPEFKVWSETIIGISGSANFLTGIGGFLQAIIAGYGGVRFHRNDDTNTMEIKKPQLLPNTNELIIKGIKFATATFNLQTNGEQSTVECTSLGENQLELLKGNEKSAFKKGSKIEIDKTIYIKVLS